MKNKSFRFLWVGQVFANLGDIFYVVGLISLIYALTGSAFYMSLLPFTTTMFRFISNLFAPLVIDRFPLKQILVQSQWLKTLLLILLVCYLFIFEQPMILLISICIALISLLDGVAAPVSSSLTPLLVPKEDWIKANGFLSVLTQGVSLTGWSLGAILLAITDSSFIILLTVILYALSAVCMMHINLAIEKDSEESVQSTRWDSFKSGWVAIYHAPPIRLVIVSDFITSIASGIWIAAVLYVYVEDQLHRSEEWWGYLNTGHFLGMIVGGILTLRFSSQLEKHSQTYIIFGLFIDALLTFLFGVTSLPLLSLLITVIHGFPQQIREIAFTKVIQDHATEKMLAKVYSSWNVVINFTFALSVLLLGYITEAYGVKTTFTFASLLIFIAFSLFLVRKNDLVSLPIVRNNDVD